MGNGGGIIKRKLLFAVLLIFGLSMTGIAASSAAPIGHAKTQSVDTYTVEKNANTHAKIINNKYLSVKKHMKTGKHVKISRNKSTLKQVTMLNKNIIAKKIKTNNTKTTKVINTRTTNTGYKYKNAAAGSPYTYKYIKRSAAVNDSNVSSLAASLTNGVSSPYEKGSRIFNWVRDNVRYKFYYDTRYGTSGTLKSRVGNCADHAHLVVDLARSAGLPARYVHADARFRSGHTYGHVWAQVYANGEWYTADATSTRNSFGVARNWSSARVKGIYNELPF